MTFVKDLAARLPHLRAMRALTSTAAAATARRLWLKSALAHGGGAGAATSLLLLDTLAAIGFAAGLAGSIVAVPDGLYAMLPWLFLVAGAGSVRGLASMLSVRVGARRAFAAKQAVRTQMTRAALHQAPGGDRVAGRAMNALVDEVEAIDGYIARFVPARMAAAAAPLMVLAATAVASPISALILAGTLLPFILALALAGGAGADQSRRQFAALSHLSGLFADRIRALPIVLAFRAEERQAGALGHAAEDLARRTMRVLRIAFLSSGALEFFAALSVALVAVYAGFNLLGLLPFPVPETLDLGRAFFVLALAPEFYAPMRRLAAAYHDKQMAETAADRLTAFAAQAPVSTPLSGPTRAPRIRFDNVGIRYPGESESAVRGFTLDVPAGNIVALIGPSGSGKSSLLHLLLGLAPLSQGTVHIDETELAPGQSIAPIAAWAGQQPLILPGTIRDNILLGCANATDRDLGEAIVQAGLGQTLFRRESGLESHIDMRGGGLSGGERRRIALARAILKRSPVLLLDEPTAHLDARAEDEMIAAIRRAAQGRTTIVATHSHAVSAIADLTIDMGARG